MEAEAEEGGGERGVGEVGLVVDGQRKLGRELKHIELKLFADIYIYSQIFKIVKIIRVLTY
jgi:hypothetical protein